MVTSALVCLREVKVCRLSQSIAIELTDICKSRDSGWKFQILELKRTLDKLRDLKKKYGLYTTVLTLVYCKLLVKSFKPFAISYFF